MKLAEPAIFQSITLGEYKVTFLPGGEAFTIPDKEGKSLMSLGSFLIEYKNEKILFDLASGKFRYSAPE